jgi:ubiquinone biosynthesis monooxygenase Coq7
MKADEIRHAKTASQHGARDLPFPVRVAMKLSSKLMTKLSYVV